MRPRPQPRREPEWVGIGSVPNPAKPRGLERDLQSSIVDALEAAGIWVERMHSGRKRVNGGWMKLHTPGMPDLMCIQNSGRVAFIECKRDELEEPNDNQRRVHAMLEQRGHRVATCWTVQQAVDFVRAERGRTGER